MSRGFWRARCRICGSTLFADIHEVNFPLAQLFLAPTKPSSCPLASSSLHHPTLHLLLRLHMNVDSRCSPTGRTNCVLGGRHTCFSPWFEAHWRMEKWIFVLAFRLEASGYAHALPDSKLSAPRNYRVWVTLVRLEPRGYAHVHLRLLACLALVLRLFLFFTCTVLQLFPSLLPRSTKVRPAHLKHVWFLVWSTSTLLAKRTNSSREWPTRSHPPFPARCCRKWPTGSQPPLGWWVSRRRLAATDCPHPLSARILACSAVFCELSETRKKPLLTSSTGNKCCAFHCVFYCHARPPADHLRPAPNSLLPPTHWTLYCSNQCQCGLPRNATKRTRSGRTVNSVTLANDLVAAHCHVM